MALKISSTISLCILALSNAYAQTTAPQEDIRGPRDLIEIPAPPPPPDYTPLWITASALILILAALLIMRLCKKNHRQLAPEIIAKQSLQKLQPDDPHHTHESFANDVSAILRIYIQARFSIAATKRSTEEFLHEVSSSSLGNHQQTLQSFLHNCDIAKFANSPLHADTRRQLIEQANTFVSDTTAPAS